jgi:hypothetical protein
MAVHVNQYQVLIYIAVHAQQVLVGLLVKLVINYLLIIFIFYYWFYTFFKDNPCYNNPCLNGATCQANINSYRCVCPQYYSGTNCQICIIYSLYEKLI